MKLLTLILLAAGVLSLGNLGSIAVFVVKMLTYKVTQLTPLYQPGNTDIPSRQEFTSAETRNVNNSRIAVGGDRNVYGSDLIPNGNGTFRYGWYYDALMFDQECASFATALADSAYYRIGYGNDSYADNRGVHIYPNTTVFDHWLNPTGDVSFSGNQLVFRIGFSNLTDLTEIQKLNETAPGPDRDGKFSAVISRIINQNLGFSWMNLDAKSAAFQMNGQILFQSHSFLLDGSFKAANATLLLNLNPYIPVWSDGILTTKGASTIMLNTTTKGDYRSTHVAIISNEIGISALNYSAILNLEIYNAVLEFSGMSVELNKCTIISNRHTIWIYLLSGTIIPLLVTVFVFRRKLEDHMNKRYRENQPFRPQPIALSPRNESASAEDEIQKRTKRFYQKYPPKSNTARTAAKETWRIPSSMQQVDSPFTLMEPRVFNFYPWVRTVPIIEIGKLDIETGRQLVSFETTQPVSIQSNFAFLPFQNLDALPSYDNGELPRECYYRVKLVELDLEASVSVGFATAPYAPFRLPGYDNYSIALHTFDSAVYMNSKTHPKTLNGFNFLAEGDEIGLGYYLSKNDECVFYVTINGKRIIQEFTDAQFEPKLIYPTIGATGNCMLEVNFGTVHPIYL